MSNYETLKKVYKEFSIDLKGASEQQLEAYPWDECVADQIARYGDEETANKVCGAIKAGMQKSFAEGDDLSNACWPTPAENITICPVAAVVGDKPRPPNVRPAVLNGLSRHASIMANENLAFLSVKSSRIR